jgi:hypothetical protein
LEFTVAAWRAKQIAEVDMEMVVSLTGVESVRPHVNFGTE